MYTLPEIPDLVMAAGWRGAVDVKWTQEYAVSADPSLQQLTQHADFQMQHLHDGVG